MRIRELLDHSPSPFFAGNPNHERRAIVAVIIADNVNEDSSFVADACKVQSISLYPDLRGHFIPRFGVRLSV